MSIIPAQRIKTKELEDGTKFKGADATDVAIRTVKCTGEGNAVDDDADHSHTKVEFVKFKLTEPRNQDGLTYAVPCTLDPKKKLVSRLVLKIGDEEITVPTQGGKLELMLAKAQLPVQAFLSMDYTSPSGGRFYIEDHAMNIDFTKGKEQGAKCCVIC